MKNLIYSVLLLSVTTLSQASNELSLYFIPSPYGMDWSTPETVLKSAIRNRLSFTSRFIGHVFVELKCESKHELTGMSSDEFDYLNQLFIEKKGLGVLFHSFKGRMEEKEKILPELNGYLKKGTANFIRFKLNEGQCQRANLYLEEYRKNNVGRNYGLANRPRHGEGAGCSAFAASFPDVLNIMDGDMRQAWSQTILIPLKYAGSPLTNEEVSFFTVYQEAKSWAQLMEEHQRLTFWDPDRMFQWVKNKAAQKSNDYTVSKIENAQGIVFDKSHYPIPQEPIWTQQLNPKNPKETAVIQESLRPIKRR